MKRKSKILALLLTLVLVVACFVFTAAPAAAADDTGVTTNQSSTFETTAAGTTVTHDTTLIDQWGVSSQIKGATLVWQKYGTATVVGGTNCDGTSNNYIMYVPDQAGEGVGAHYFVKNSGIATNPATSQISDGKNNVAYRLDAYTSLFEFDVFFPGESGLIQNGAAVKLYTRYLDASGTLIKRECTNYGFQNYDTDSDGVEDAVRFGINTKIGLSANEWSRISIAISTEAAGSSYNVVGYLFINGKYQAKDTLISGIPYYTDAGGVKHTAINLTEYRLLLSGAPTTPNATKGIAYDNIYLKHINNDLDASKTHSLASVIENEGSLSLWNDARYTKGSMPFGKTVATNTTTGKTYDSLQYAVDCASAGDNITLSTSITETVYVDKLITVTTAGNTANIVGRGEYGVNYDEETGIYTSVNLSATSVFSYELSDGSTGFADDLATAVANVKTGGTVSLLRNYTINRVNTTGEYFWKDSTIPVVQTKTNASFTLNLKGHTLTYQQGDAINTLDSNYFQIPFFFMGWGTNITIVGNDEGGANGAIHATQLVAARNFPFAFFSGSCTLTLENVDTQMGCLAYNNATTNNTVIINGGIHNIPIVAQGARDGYIASANYLTNVEATGATFYLSSTGNGVVSQSVDVTGKQDITTPVTVGTFTGCKFICTNENTSFIRLGSEITTYVFNDCDIYGKIAPTLRAQDSALGLSAMGASNIIIGEGTRFNASDITCGYTLDEGLISNPLSTTETVTVNDCDDAPHTNGFVLSPRNVKCTYAAEAVDTSNCSIAFDTANGTVYTNDFATAAANVTSGGTIWLLKDVDVTRVGDASTPFHGDSTIPVVQTSGTFTLNLKGHTLSYTQGDGSNTVNVYQVPFFYLTGSAKLTIVGNDGGGANGKIVATRKNHNGNFPFIFAGTSNGRITVTNVDTQMGAFIYLQGTSSVGNVVTVTGGTHHIDKASNGARDAYIDTNNPASINVSGATFYLTSNASGVLSATLYGASDLTTVRDIATFTDCQFICELNNGTFIRNASAITNVYFNNCDIYGRIAPLHFSSDSGKGIAAMNSSNIIFGLGTRFTSSKIVCGYIFEENVSEGSIDESESVSVADTTVECTYTTAAVEAAEATMVYINSDGQEVQTNSLSVAVNNAKAGTTITLLCDITIANTAATGTTAEATLTKALTIDLDGYSIYFKQYNQNTIYLSSGADLTLKNGTVYAARFDAAATNRGYSVFQVTSDNVSLTLEGVNTYVASLVHTRNKNITVTVNGGTHHAVFTGAGVWGGFVESRGTMNFTATGATFYTDSDSWIITSGSTYANSLDDKTSTFTFNNCKLLSDTTQTGNLVKYANENTRIVFNGCDIYGDINPQVKTEDKNASGNNYNAMSAGSIIMGVGTRYNGTRTLIGGGVIVTPDGYALGVVASDITVNITDISDTPANTDFALDAAADKTFTFTMSAVLPSEYNFKFTSGGVEAYTDDLLEAFANVDAGGTVTFLSDYELTSDGHPVYRFTSDITIDLNGNVFSVIQTAQTTFHVGANLTIENGEIRNVRDNTPYSGAIATDKSYTLFMFAAYNKTITLNDVNTYTGAFIYTQQVGSTVIINGGVHQCTHHESASAQGVWGGFVESRNNMTFTANNATFFVDASGWVVTAASSYDDVSSPRGNSFTFNNCKLISDPDNSDGNFHLVKYANENTKLYFYGCYIAGSITPTVFSGDKKDVANGGTELWGDMPAANVYLGNETRIATLIRGTNLVIPDGYSFTNASESLLDENYKLIFEVTRCNDKPFTNGYQFTHKVYTITFSKVVINANEITVTFHYPDGTTTQQSYKNGDVVEFPTYEVPVKVNNGWVIVEYDGGWSLTGYGEKLDSFTVSGRHHFYPSATVGKAHMIDAMYNLSLYGNVGVNLLVPDSAIPDGITIVGVYDADGNVITAQRTGIPAKGRTYSSFAGNKVSVLELNENVVFKVVFTFYGIELTQTITLNPAAYVERILTDSNSNAEAKTLLADMIVYANTLNKYASRNDSATVSAFEETITLANGSETTLNTLAAEFASTMSAESTFTGGTLGNFASTLVTGMGFNVGGAEPSYIVYFPESARVVDVKFVMSNAWLNNTPGYDKGEVIYSIDAASSSYYGSGYLSMAHSTGVSVYNLDHAVGLVLTVLDEHGARFIVECTGEYNLNNYYTGVGVSDGFTADDVARAKTVMRALRTYADSSAAYRFGQTNAGILADNTVNIYYEDYGAKGDGTTDDFAAIQAAHAAANAEKDAGRDVTVYAIKPNGTIKEGATFYIENATEGTVTHGTSVEIRTNTVWTGANFKINDSLFVDETEVEKHANTAMYTPIFTVISDNIDERDAVGVTYTTTTYDGSLLTTTTHIDKIVDLELPFEWALVEIRNTAHKNWRRYGVNASADTQHELVLVNTRTGKIDPSTPIAYDFQSVTSLRIYNADEDRIVITGGTFETLYNQVNSYSYCKRGIYITRSNVTVEGLTQSYTYSDWNDYDNKLTDHGSPMHLFVGTEYTHGVTIDNCTLEGPKEFYSLNSDGTKKALRGSYSVRADATSSLTISNCVQTNFFEDTDGNGTDDLDHQAIMGTNYCKNFHFIGNTFSVFDSHTALHNLVIEDCEVERINIIGSGDVTVRNTKIHTGNTNAAIVLRDDYQSEFNGNIRFENITLQTYTNKFVALFRLGYYNYNTGNYYSDGYQWTSGNTTITDTYYAQDKTKGDGDDSRYYSSVMPSNVYIDGLYILKADSIDTTGLKGAAASSMAASASERTFALVTANNENVAFHDAIRNGDISTIGSEYKTGGYWNASGTYKNGTTYTVSHAYKGTENVYKLDLGGYSIVEYAFLQTNVTKVFGATVSSTQTVWSGNVAFLTYNEYTTE